MQLSPESEAVITEFESSRLGSKEHWDEVYHRELNNFEESGDIGEIWFGEDVEETVVDWLEELTGLSKERSRVLDVGCGNGHLLLELARRGWKNLTGIDYSAGAVQLATRLAESEDYPITFLEDDALASRLPAASFDLLLDKGTFDAIALSAQRENRGRYVEAMHRLCSKDALAVITSCNFTRELSQELVAIWQQSHLFKYHSHIKYPIFSFGGQEGSKVATVAFRPV